MGLFTEAAACTAAMFMFTRAIARYKSGSSPTTVIEQELKKLIQLAPEMADHDFDDSLLCPISASLMLDPVTIRDHGRTYTFDRRITHG